MDKLEITEVIVNGKVTAARQVQKIITSMGNHEIIAAKGGYIFSASIKDSTLTLGILPYFIGNHRTRHYDIEMPEDKYMLVGFINANATLDLMFKVSKNEYKTGLSREIKEQFARRCITFASFIIEHGFPANCTVNEVTIALMAEIGINLEHPHIAALAQPFDTAK